MGNLTYVLPPKLNTYASLWQQDNLGYKYFSNVYSLYQPGYQSYYNYLGYYFSTHNKRFQLYFGDYNGPRVALKEGMVFDLGLDFDIPDGPLQGAIRITTSPNYLQLGNRTLHRRDHRWTTPPTWRWNRRLQSLCKPIYADGTRDRIPYHHGK